MDSSIIRTEFPMHSPYFKSRLQSDGNNHREPAAESGVKRGFVFQRHPLPSVFWHTFFTVAFVNVSSMVVRSVWCYFRNRFRRIAPRRYVEVPGVFILVQNVYEDRCYQTKPTADRYLGFGGSEQTVRQRNTGSSDEQTVLGRRKVKECLWCWC